MVALPRSTPGARGVLTADRTDPPSARGRRDAGDPTASRFPAAYGTKAGSERFTPGERALLAVVVLAFLHHVDHVLRADNSGWPFTPVVTPFTISLVVYPIFVLDFLLLRRRPWVRVGLVAVLSAALQIAHAVFEPPADQYGTWAHGTSSVPHALGQPNLLGTASPVLGALSVAISSLLSVTVLVALLLLAREALRSGRTRA
jgi:hypothetical protein